MSRENEPAKKKARTGDAPADDDFVEDAEACTTVVVVETAAEFRAALAGPPEAAAPPADAPPFVHQIFPPNDEDVCEIKGFKGISITVFVAATIGRVYCRASYDETKGPATDVAGKLAYWFTAEQGALIDVGQADGPFPNADAFAAALEGNDTTYATTPSGEELGEPLHTFDAGDAGTVAVYAADLKPDAEVANLHRRLEPLLPLYIDGANTIDTSDGYWMLMLARCAPSGGAPSKTPPPTLGLATVYRHYHYTPDGAASDPSGGSETRRFKLSQLLVLPRYRGRGVGRAMVRALHALASARGAVDVTFEDPTPQVTLMRDREDFLRLREARSGRALEAAAEAAKDGSLRPSADDAAWMRREGLLSPRQLARIWEVLLWAASGSSTATEALLRRKAEEEKRRADASAKCKRFVNLRPLTSGEDAGAADRGQDGGEEGEDDGDNWMMAKHRGLKGGRAVELPDATVGMVQTVMAALEGGGDAEAEAEEDPVATRLVEIRKLLELCRKG
ncbi:unnamed protein product [Pedinophyceae sp. YPF-701]|nr:unnamed protein product [Pedinophyceae sp. YPF-701]